MKGEQALEVLLKGNERFVKGEHTFHDLLKERLLTADGQHPFATVIACSDSREPVEYIFDQGLGDLFVIRTAGNTLHGEDSFASLEYAVVHLNTPLVVVLGHEDCGAVKAALAGGEEEQELLHLIQHLQRNIEVEKQGSLLDYVKRNVRATIKRMLSKEFIKRKVERGELMIVGAVHHLASGRVEVIEVVKHD